MRSKAIWIPNYLPRKENIPFFENNFLNKAKVLVPWHFLPCHISKDHLIIHISDA